MRRTVAIAGVAAAVAMALGLSSCEEGALRGGDRSASARGAEGLCKPFTEPGASASATAGAAAPVLMDGAMVVDDCLHRWGYTLAGSKDDADAVARAVVAACGAPLARWNQQSLSAAAERGRPGQAPSPLTGQPTSPIMEHNAFAEGRALFYVVQARVGNCEPPRVRVPEPRGGAGSPAYAPNSPDR